MKRLSKVFGLVIVLTLASSLFTACGAAWETSEDTGEAGKSSETLDIGIVLPTKDEPRWIQDETRFRSILNDTGYTVEILFSQGSPAKEKENVEALIAKGIKVLVLAPQDGAAAAASAEAARAEGIPVISYDRLITDTNAVDYYVTFDSIAVGAAQGQYLIDQAKGKGVPLYLYAGAPTDNNSFLFFGGAWTVLQPKIADGTFVIANSSEATALKDKLNLTRDELSKIIGQVTTNWDFNEAKNKAETHLTAVKAGMKGDVAILAPNDGTARSIADVFAADPAVKSYVISGQDAEIASVQYVIDGKQSMTVFKDVRILAKDAMDMAVTILGGAVPETTGTYNNGKIEVKAKQTEILVVDRSNVKKAIIDSGYYTADEFTGL